MKIEFDIKKVSNSELELLKIFIRKEQENRELISQTIKNMIEEAKK